MAEQVSVSKLTAYAVLATPEGISATKVNAYAVLTPITPAINATKVVAYAVLLSPVSPVWAGFSFGNGVIWTPYSYTFSFVAGTFPITTTLLSGSLPPGLTLSSTGSTGTIAGTPTTAGSYSFTLKATNAYGTANSSFTIVVLNTSGGGGAWVFVS